MNQPVPRAVVVTITPEIAEHMLETNTCNRPIRQNRVNVYAEEMKNGKWLLTGESIKVSRPDDNGETRLIDGQHRLWACIESGVAFETYVIYDVADEAMVFIDSGLPRSVGDMVSLEGMDYANWRSSVSRLILGWRAGVLNNTNKWAVVATRDKILDFAKENLDAQTYAIRTASQIRRVAGGPITAIGAFIFEITRINPDKADEFVEAWRDPDVLAPDSPVRALRHWMFARAVAKKRTETATYLFVMVKAWNAFVTNQPMKIMRVQPNADIPELLGATPSITGGTP